MATHGEGSDTEVSLRPGISVLAVLPHLNYRLWFAVAEFVDNAIQSWTSHRHHIASLDATATKLRVTIEISADRSQLRISDNAAGIFDHEMTRAFRPAEPPPDRRGLSEFGMGMKSAACWLSPRWSVCTKAIGEPHEKLVELDIDAIVADQRETARVRRRAVPSAQHYTVVTLEQLRANLVGRTLGKLKDHLATIYRDFIRAGDLELLLRRDGVCEQLRYEEPEVLNAPYFRTADTPPRKWRKDIRIDLGEGRLVTGFAALRSKGSTSDAGFSLFRRRRVIQGTSDEGYRPEVIFKRSNSYTWQRLFGELHLDGFSVTHTKDGFRWDGLEDRFLDELHAALDAEPLPLLKQAEGFRAREFPSDLRVAAEHAASSTAIELERAAAPVLTSELLRAAEPPPPPPQTLSRSTQLTSRTVRLELHRITWIVSIEISDSPGALEWLEVAARSEIPEEHGVSRGLTLRLCSNHPFTARFQGPNGEGLEVLLRLAAAVGLAIEGARLAGASKVDTVRRNLNQLLREALSEG